MRTGPNSYRVVVSGGVGTVYNGPSKLKALGVFNEYVRRSKSGKGKSGNENVDLYSDYGWEKGYEADAAEVQQIRMAWSCIAMQR